MQRSREGAVVLVVVLLVLFVGPLLYLGAIGPLVWLNGTGRINITPDSLIARMYWPLEVAVNHCEPLEHVLQTYISVWEPTPGIAAPSPPAQYVAPAPAIPLPSPAQGSAVTTLPAPAASAAPAPAAAAPPPTEPAKSPEAAACPS